LAAKAKDKFKVKMKIKAGDRVKVIAGKDKNREGKVLLVNRETNRVVVENVNMVVKHQKPTSASQQGGRIEKEAPIHVSNVMYLHKGKPTRIGYQIEVIERDGRKVKTKKRVAKATGEVID